VIQVDRGLEPASLPAIREEERDRVRPLFAATGFNREQLGKRYTEVKRELCVRQHYKCCYCEKVCEDVGNDLEHYRPASLYWWLSWTWSNLLFACQNCNRWGKNDEFPLANLAARLVAEQDPPQREEPLLVDPAAEDPMDSIHFVFEEKSGRWLPRPRGASVRGAETIRVLGLDRQALLENFKRHVDLYVVPDADHLKRLMAAGDEAGARIFWERVVQRRLQRTSYFTALTYDALDHFFPSDVRVRWGLDLPRP